MRHYFVFFSLLGLLGCASEGGGSAGTPKDATTHAQAVAKIHTELAASYFERGQHGIALQEIEVALQSEAKYAPAFNVRGLIRMALREDKEADEDFRRSLQLDSKDSNTHNNYGWFLCQRDRTNEAVAQFLEAVKNPLYSTPETAYVNAGICSTKMGKFKDAEDYFQRALARQPHLAGALVGLAQVSFESHDYAGAKSYFLRFLQNAPDLSAEQLWLGVRIERKMGDRNSEESYALQLRKHYPDSREAQLLAQGE